MVKPVETLFRFYKKHYHTFHLFSILLLTIVVLWPIHSFSFLIGWDDQTFVTNHYTEDGLFSKNIYAILTEFYHGQYAPVNQLYYSSLYELFDYNPFYFHTASIILHLLNIVLVYLFIFEVSRILFNYPFLNVSQIAFFTALLFAIAPINLEPVAWVAASKVLLYALFYLIALLCYLKYLNHKANKYYYFTFLSFLLSFGAKEQAVTLPFTMFLIDYIYKRDFKNTILWLEKTPLFLLSLLFALASVQSQQRGVVATPVFYLFIDKIPLFFYTVFEYLTKIILPVNLSYVYPFPFQIGKKPPLWLWIYPIAIPVIIYCLNGYFKKKWVMFTAMFFLIHIVLVCNFLSLARHSFIADRYAYLSTIGVFFPIAIVLTKIMDAPSWRKYLLPVTIIYICYFASYTNLHSIVWENAITLKGKMKTVIEGRSDYKSWKYKKEKKK